MPIYEYKCAKCETQFELLIRGNEEACCPNCGAAELEKLLSVAAISTSPRSSSNFEIPPCGNSEACCKGNCGLFENG